MCVNEWSGCVRTCVCVCDVRKTPMVCASVDTGLVVAAVVVDRSSGRYIAVHKTYIFLSWSSCVHNVSSGPALT